MIEELRSKYPRIESHLFVGMYRNIIINIVIVFFLKKNPTGSRLTEERQENEINEDDDNVPLITNTTNISIRRKQIPRWKRILCCGI
jgi:hypothetical protein